MVAASDSFGLSASATVEESRLGPAISVEGISQLSDATGTAIGLEPALFDLAVCAEMVFLDLPFEQRVRRIAEYGFQVEIWNWIYHDIDALVQTGARFSSMVGHTAGSLLDDDGANALLRSAEESLAVAERLNCRRLLVFGTELGPDGVPLRPVHEVTGAMWLNAHKTLCRLAELGERAGVTFCLENLNTVIDHPGAPFARAQDTLALVEAVNRPGLRMMLDLYHAQIGEGNLSRCSDAPTRSSERFRSPMCPAVANQAQERSTTRRSRRRSKDWATAARSDWRHTRQARTKSLLSGSPRRSAPAQHQPSGGKATEPFCSVINAVSR
jgi:hydroxypyruvate isomerase